MLLIEYVGHIGLRSLTDGHLGRHLEYFKTLNDARVASVGFIKYNASTTRINKEKTLKSSSRSFWFSTRLRGCVSDPGPVQYFPGYISWTISNIIHFLPLFQEGILSVICKVCALSTGYLLCLGLPIKSLVRSDDRLDMTIAVDCDVKPQTKQTKINLYGSVHTTVVHIMCKQSGCL